MLMINPASGQLDEMRLQCKTMKILALHYKFSKVHLWETRNFDIPRRVGHNLKWSWRRIFAQQIFQLETEVVV